MSNLSEITAKGRKTVNHINIMFLDCVRGISSRILDDFYILCYFFGHARLQIQLFGAGAFFLVREGDFLCISLKFSETYSASFVILVRPVFLLGFILQRNWSTLEFLIYLLPKVITVILD